VIVEGQSSFFKKSNNEYVLLFSCSYTAGEIDVSSDKIPEQRALLVEGRRSVSNHTIYIPPPFVYGTFPS